MSFESVYKKLGVVIVEHALDEDRDLFHMDRGFGARRAPTARDLAPVEPLRVNVSEWLGLSSGALNPDEIPADLADWLETHPVLIRLASRLLAAPATLVRVDCIDGRNLANWLSPWRQVKHVSLAERHRVTGFRNWSEQGPVWMAEAPTWVLEQSVTLQVYLDACAEDDGPVEVLTGSHDKGRLKRTELSELVREGRALTCLCARGDILALSPLAVRRRHRARETSQRRVLEMTFTAATLPQPLTWASLTPQLDQVSASE